MARMPVEPICNFPIVKAEYGRIEANGRTPFYGYRIALNLNAETEIRFDVKQESADELAKELGSLAALILAHGRHREPS
jgi:hypothetical protein